MACAHPPTAPHVKSATEVQRILFITRKWGPAVGGMETYCERLTEELAKTRDIDVIALKGRTNGLSPSAFSLLLFPFTVLRALFRQSSCPSMIWPLALMALTFFPRAQIILSAHGTDVSYGARGGIKGGLYEFYQKIGARLLSKAKVIANSDMTKQRLSQIGWSCSAVVPLATDLKAEQTGEFNRQEILFAGRLITQKGLSWLVRNVLPQLPEDVRLTVIGTLWDKSEEAALDHPQVDFLGRKSQSELAQHFAQAACVVVPNIVRDNGEFEGFGLIACEAASAGGLVLAADTGGLSDAVKDGETGFLIEAGNAQKWVAKIRQVLEQDPDERAQFLSRSQGIARSHYAWDRVALQTAEVYTSCS